MAKVSSSKFACLLKTFDEGELKAFERWLESPWCNSNMNLPRLLAKLKPYYPDFSDETPTKEKLFSQVLPKGKFSDRRMNNLLSEAYLAAERFLSFQRFDQEPSMQADLLTRELQSRYIDNWFFKASAAEIGRLEKKRVKEWEDHLGLFFLHRRIYHHPHLEPRLQAGRSTIVNMNVQLDLLYALEKAALINEMIFRNRIFKEDNHAVASELEKWQAASQEMQHPAIELYRMRFAYTEENFLTQYWALRDAFVERLEKLHAREQKTQLLSLLNDTALLIKSGRIEIADSLPLYKLGLETGALLNQGKLTRNTFSTIVSASNSKGDFDFTARFIDTYAAKLDEKVRSDCMAWAKSHTAYWRKDLETCLMILQDFSFKTFHFQLIGRVLHAQVYFDLYLQDPSYESFLFSYFDSFEKWLQREKGSSKAVKDSFLRFVQTCRTLARYHAQLDPEPEKLEKLLDQQSNIQALNWLQTKKAEVKKLRSKKT